MRRKLMGKTRKLLSVLLVLALVGIVPIAPAIAAEGGAEDVSVTATAESGDVEDRTDSSTNVPRAPVVQSGESAIAPFGGVAALFEPQATAAEIVLQAQETGKLTIGNKWSTSIVVSGSGQADTTFVAPGCTTTLMVIQGETLAVRETVADATFRSWRYSDSALVSGVPCTITDMPSMSAFTTDSAGTTAGDNFFHCFDPNDYYLNQNGSLTSLPAGSFDTSGITTVGDYFFSDFNCFGRLTSLPVGSFNTSNITTAGDYFFYDFNHFGTLTSLPAGSFNTSNITTAGDYFFGSFNFSGFLTSLPAGSFNTSNITTTGDNFFYDFSGSLTSLPVGSFNTSGITTVGDHFFAGFSSSGHLTSLPAGSFDTSNITNVGSGFFYIFDSYGSLTSLPRSFKLPQALKFVGEYYCSSMFANSALTRGNEQVPLYFAAAASYAFTGTDINPASPSKGTTVYVNGDGLPGDPSKTASVKVTANSKGGGIVAVPGATVSLYDNSGGNTIWLKDATEPTDANGIAQLDISGLTTNQLKNATVSARYAIGATEINNGGTARNPLFEKFGTGSNGQPVRMIYELHSEWIDANGIWRGEKLPQTGDTLELKLSEPRILVNLAVAYMDDTNDSSYRQKVQNTMSVTSRLLAQATDGHVMLNKVLLLPVYNRLDFVDLNKWESMADVQIQSTIGEDVYDWLHGWTSIKARSNAHPDGFYSDETEQFVKDSGFEYLPDARNYEGKSSYQRVQMSGTEGGGWDSSKLGTLMYAETLTHELGHYLLGFWDEYIGYKWDASKGEYVEYESRGEIIHPNGKPYGLMSNQHDDIEASRLISDYSYVAGGTPRENLTVQWFLWHYSPLNQSGLVNASCEGVLGYLLDWNLSSSDHFNSPYWGTYTLAPSNTNNNDRRANYFYAMLDDSSFKDPRYDTPFIWDDLAMANSQYATQAQTQSVEPLAEDTTGKIYVSDTQNVIAYIDYGQGGSAQFSVDATERSNGDYFAVSEATEVTVTSTGQPFGEFYSEVASTYPIDFTSLTWFRYAQDTWTALDTDITLEPESLNYGARTDYAGDGIYVLMATSPQGPSPEPIQVTSFEASDERDATGEITINDPNPSDNSYLYTIYWSEQPFNSGNEAGVQSEVVRALGTGSYTLSLGEANKRYYVRASVLGTDGQTSALGTAFQLDTIWADRDHDGIPDWYCDKYLLWGPDEEKDIAASDENGNGISNLDEYLRGTDPTYVSETYVVTFNPNGGTVSPTTVSKAPNAAIGTLPTPTRTGYVFDGWYTAASGGTKITTTTKVTATVTYYAHWKATSSSYTVTFNPNGGTVSPTTTSKAPNAAIGTLPTPTRTGYTFEGWYTAAIGGTKITTTTTVTATVTYYAHWTTGTTLNPSAAITQHAGADRFDTAAQASLKAYPDPSKVDSVILSLSSNFPDALAASYLAGVADAPILLTSTAELHTTTLSELNRLSPKTIYITGSEGAIGKQVEEALQGLSYKPSVKRLGGATRVQTAISIANEAKNIQGTPQAAFVVFGGNYPDALSVGSLSAALNIPILLTEKDMLNQEARVFLEDNAIKDIIVIGGTSVIGEAVAEQLKGLSTGPTVSRWSGDNRYATASDVIERATAKWSLKPTSVGIALGDNFPDALVGGAAMGNRGGILVICPSKTLSDAARAVITANKTRIQSVEIFGGPSVIDVRGAVQELLS